MNKIEYMAMSLPFGLKCLELQHIGDKNGEIGTFTGYEFDMFSIIQDVRMPILRPLSDLTKEIEHKGEKFIPIVELSKLVDRFNNAKPVFVEVNSINGLHYEWYSEFDNIRRSVPFIFYLKLVEWKFDIGALIEEGEAVDFHTLPDFSF